MYKKKAFFFFCETGIYEFMNFEPYLLFDEIINSFINNNEKKHSIEWADYCLIEDEEFANNFCKEKNLDPNNYILIKEVSSPGKKYEIHVIWYISKEEV